MHGGVAFGPHPRDYSKDMPKKMRQLALRCLISSKVSEGSLRIVEKFNFDAPKTKQVLDVLDALKLTKTALIVTAATEVNVVKSARNIPCIKTSPDSILNVVDLLTHEALVMTEEAVRKAEQIWGKELSQEENSAAL